MPNNNRHAGLTLLTGLALMLVFAASAIRAQEGFPLDGTWRAHLNGNRTVVVIMKWDGENINGLVNPGPNSVDFRSARLDASNWGVHIEATAANGDAIVIDGTLVDIGSYNRRIVGTWSEGATTSELDLRRE